MKIIPAVVLLVIIFFSVHSSFAQDTVMHDIDVPDSVMRDTIIARDPSFVVRGLHIPNSVMQDTIIVRDPSFVVRDLYAKKDSVDAMKVSLAAIKDSLTAIADSIYKDSVNRHWMGWEKYKVKPGYSYTLFSKSVLRGRSKSQLQYNIADFYLYMNGQLVKPPETGNDFFAAGCLCFKYDDTLLLNSGLGFKVGVGVGIKIIQGRFTSSLHANTHNAEIYKQSKNDTAYMKSVMAEPVTQSLNLRSEPAYASNEVITGEYEATYKKFYQKNDDDQDEVRRYTVKIIFRCRVTGGIDSIKSLSGTNSK
jgi:hypothetical protein